MQNEMKPIRGFENYLVTAFGTVINARTWLCLKPYLRNGYLSIKLLKNGKRKNFDVHRMVAEHFLERPRPHKAYNYVNHKSLDRHDNRVENLEWVTQARNIQHYYESRWLRNPHEPCEA